ncbi:SLBB domain-containing protein [Leptothoe spongobia]|uniref:SLBB domain-containing protein n=1 Tax=Leptothoe spongobia TAU-MAC 1115 TaxID=1967444 RepID=A0A947GQY9_9CYAN|nr:SLBB domain-containing protein [Leptothoe spongobia]MBT9317276.1 SLBB domain-containing protein [Leptothoe spongobia TAU-MAC 1115]
MALASISLCSIQNRLSLFLVLYVFSSFSLLHPTAPAIAQTTQLSDLSSEIGRQSSIGGYVLGTGDKIHVDVFRVPQYSGDYEILGDGLLLLPMVGQVSVAGLTIGEAQSIISQAYASRLRRPIINVTLLSPRPLKIGIAGEVSRPGIYTLQREGTQALSLVDALEIAGGITQSADLQQIVIRRSTSGGSEQILVSNLQDFLDTGDLSHDLFLMDGDTILVPTNEQFDHDAAWQVASASFAADENRPLNIVVVGEVFRPGPYTVTGTARTGEAGVPGGTGSTSTPPTVTRAIQVAGGIKPEANIRDIQVSRRTHAGPEQLITINLWRLLQEGDLAEDIVLKDGDTIKISQATDVSPTEITEIAASSFSPDTIAVNVVGEVDRPGIVEVAPNTPLSQGLLAAGGFNNRATRRDVDLIRLNADGTATKSSIDVDFSVGIDDEMNPLLRNNDIIVVRRSGSARISDTLDTIAAPLTSAFSIFALPSTILRLFD